MANYDLGTLGSNPQVIDNGDLFISDPTDVYEFELTQTSNINLALTDMPAGKDADIFLFEDTNGNSVLDDDDTLIQGSWLGGNADDSINVEDQVAGTYFAQVSRYTPDVNMTYDLSLQAQPTNGEIASPSDLLPTEFELGTLSNNTLTKNGSVGSMDTADVYHFSLNNYTFGTDLQLSLTGLNSDADLRVIRDSNDNGLVDDGEVLAFSQFGSTNSETINLAELPGGDNYFIQVYQFSGDTNYQLTVDTQVVIG